MSVFGETSSSVCVCVIVAYEFLGKELLCIRCDVQCMLCVTAKQLFLHRAVGHLCVCMCVCVGADCLVSLSLTETEKDTDVGSHWHLFDSTVLNSYPAPGRYLRSCVSYSHITSNLGTQTLAYSPFLCSTTFFGSPTIFALIFFFSPIPVSSKYLTKYLHLKALWSFYIDLFWHESPGGFKAWLVLSDFSIESSTHWTV